eukprot:Phypoly_transcript_02835.p2 GENE.Phypoly_transcript_02835~~Phypoly_transcript_02835.p2  ORF type:complete len:116 (-),score=1.48 Phypoly_transcript_02835:237-584(-)
MDVSTTLRLTKRESCKKYLMATIQSAKKLSQKLDHNTSDPDIFGNFRRADSTKSREYLSNVVRTCSSKKLTLSSVVRSDSNCVLSNDPVNSISLNRLPRNSAFDVFGTERKILAK